MEYGTAGSSTEQREGGGSTVLRDPVLCQKQRDGIRYCGIQYSTVDGAMKDGTAGSRTLLSQAGWSTVLRDPVQCCERGDGV